MSKNFVGFEIDENEWQEIIKMAEDLPAKVGQNAFAKSVSQGVDLILQAMKQNIGNRAEDPTGNLAESLSKKRKKKYEPMFWHSSVAVYTGNKRADGAFYWNIVEHGHRVVTPKKKDTGKRVKAMEYAIAAVESTKASVLGDFGRRARAEIEKRWKKR